MIKIWDRKNRVFSTEKVYKGKVFNLLYGAPSSHFLTRLILERKWFSYLYGLSKKMTSSKKEIPDFISQYKIDLNEFKNKDFNNFNDFFKREFKKEARLFPKDKTDFGSICEARVTALENIKLDQDLTIKNNKISVLGLLNGDKKLAEKYVNGSLVVFRLAPVDYHHFHSPSTGTFKILKRISGRLHSVNPVSTARTPDVLMKNTRIVTEVISKNSCDFCIVAIGAFCVGTINEIPDGSQVNQYDDIGSFEFGGSSIVLLAPKDCLKIDSDILEKTQEGIECFIFLGEKMATLQTLKN